MPLISVVYTFILLSHSKVIILQKSDTLLNKTICIDVHVQQATHFLIVLLAFFHIYFIAYLFYLSKCGF